MTQIVAIPYKRGDLPELADNKSLGEHGPAFTFWHGDKVVCCAGATIFWRGCAEVWLTPGPDMNKYGYSLAIQTRRILDMFQQVYSLNRLQADVVASNMVARRFIEHYGFELEGVMRKYDVLGRDCVRYARVAE